MFPSSKVVGVWMWNVQTNVIQADQHVCEYFSVLPEDGKNGVPLERFLDGIHLEERSRVISRISRAVMSGQPFDELYRVQDRADAPCWIKANGTCFRDVDGRPTAYPGTVIDVTDAIASNHQTQIVEHLIGAAEAAEMASEPVLSGLIDLILLEAGTRLAGNLIDADRH